MFRLKIPAVIAKVFYFFFAYFVRFIYLFVSAQVVDPISYE